MMWHRPDGFTLGGNGRAHLKVEGLAAGYGPVQVLRGLRFEARPGLTVILGPNGAGKTTLLRALAGLIPRGGEVLLDGEELPEKTHEIVRAGVALVAEGRQLFPQMTVTENLELGGITLGMKTTHERMPEVLAFFPRVKERLHSRASALSGGEQKQLEIGRALLLRPKVLLIDEPSIGLSPLIVQDVFRLLRRLAEQGTTVLMVEQNVKSALQYSDEAIALESGRLVLHKAAADILADPNMERLFLGGAHPAMTPGEK